MPLMDALRSGVDLVNASNQGVMNSAMAKYAYPLTQAALYKAQTENKYLDPQLQAELHNKQLINQYYGRGQEADIGLKLAQAQAAKFKAQYPLLGETGVAGQIGAALYLKSLGYNTPEMMGTPAPVASSPVAPNAPSPNTAPMMGGGMAAPIQNSMPPSNPGMPSPQSSAPVAPMPPMPPAPPQGATGAGGLGQPVSYPDMILQGIQSNFKQKQAYTNYREKQTQAYNYMSLPIDNKAALLAQAAGMGYDPTKATNLFMAGNTIEDLAKAKGFDLGNLPDPIYPTTKTSLTQIQKREQALAEINNLNPVLTAAIAPYSQRVAGWSPEQVAQAMHGTDKDSQARLLAARALMPEMSALRLRAMTGQVGIEAIRHVTDASMGNIKVFQALVSPDIYSKANEYIDKWITGAVDAANQKGLRTYGTQPPTPASQTKTADLSKMSTEELLKMYNGGANG